MISQNSKKVRLLLVLAALPVAACSFEGQADASGESLADDLEVTTIAYGRFVPEREDDFAWENDKVAFRVYGPKSLGVGAVSGVDAWFKKVDYPIIDKWYAQSQQGKSYHEDHGEGYDRYHTGTSRGVGGTAIWVDGVAYPAGKFVSYEINKSGGDVVEFVLRYKWSTPLGQVEETKIISLEAGSQLYQVNSQFTLDGHPAAVPIAIGLTTHDEAAAVYSNRVTGRISTWEIIDDVGVGTGAIIAVDRIDDIIHQASDEKDASHIWLITAADEAGKLAFRAGFAWQAAGQISSINAWNEYLDTTAQPH